MPNCASIDPLVTSYVDGELAGADRELVGQHIRLCGTCRARVEAEQAVRGLISARKPRLQGECAPERLREKCASLGNSGQLGQVGQVGQTGRAFRSAGPASRHVWHSRVAPIALAAALVLMVGAVFLYQLTSSSSRVMAAELTADHVKCFAMNALLGTHQTSQAVESSLASSFDWPVRLPAEANRAGLELVGERPCLYGEGRVAHIMYRHNGQPVSLFMLPRTIRADELMQVFGHEAAIWSVGDRTFVLIAREPRAEVERLAAVVQASVR